MAGLLLLLSSLLLLCHGDPSASSLSPSDVELLEAAFRGHVPGVETALQSGDANPNARDPTSGQTALMGATLRGHANVVEYLLKLQNDANDDGRRRTTKVDATMPEKDGYTPAHGAGFQGRADIMRLLARNGINVMDDYHVDGFAPLHRACWGREERHTETVRVLVSELGVDINLPDRKNGAVCADMTNNPATKRFLSEHSATAASAGATEEL
jgi:ankyrin repeat protein